MDSQNYSTLDLSCRGQESQRKHYNVMQVFRNFSFIMNMNNVSKALTKQKAKQQIIQEKIRFHLLTIMTTKYQKILQSCSCCLKKNVVKTSYHYSCIVQNYWERCSTKNNHFYKIYRPAHPRLHFVKEIVFLTSFFDLPVGRMGRKQCWTNSLSLGQTFLVV